MVSSDEFGVHGKSKPARYVLQVDTVCFRTDTSKRSSQNAQAALGLSSEGQYPLRLLVQDSVRADNQRQDGRGQSIIVALQLAELF